MADKRISQLIERTDIANNDVLPIVASGATTTNKVTVSTLQDWMQDNLDVGVTSVGLSVPSAFTVSGSPVTTSGNITISGAGTTAQYIRGDGSLADFPQSAGGGGASVSYYLNGSVSQGTIGGIAYREMNKTPILGAGTDFTISSNGYIASFITDAGDPSLLLIPGGNWNFETYFEASSGGGTPSFYVELYKVDSGGTATLIASNSANPELIAFGTTTTAYFSSLAVPSTTLTLTDRLALRYYVTPAGRTITLHTENSNLCQIITTFTTGLTALNGLTAQVQNFATGTSGTDFNISSASTTHTFNLPDASASNRGAVTTGSQVFGGVKTFANGLSLPSAGGSNQVTRIVNIGTLHEGSATLNQIGFNSANNIYFGKGLSNGGVLQWTNAAVRYYTLPDADGTLALASQLGAYLPLAGGTLTGALNGTSAVFSGDVQSGTRLIAAASSQSILLTPNSGGTTNRVESVGTLPLALVSAAAITMAAGGTTPQITLTTSGTVGIGTATPATYSGWGGIDVRGTNGGHVIVANTGGTNRGEILTDVNGFNINAQTNNALLLKTNDTTRLTIASTGAATFSSSVTAASVITSDSASTAALPATSGSTQSGGHRLRLTTNGASTAVIDYGTAGGSGGWIQAAIKDSLGTTLPLLLNPNGGNVGIGTASPVSLSGYTSLSLNGSTGALFNGQVNGVSASYFGVDPDSTFLYELRNKFLGFGTNNTERMRITSAGNVGIGTDSPTDRGHINTAGSGASDRALRLSNPNQNFADCTAELVFQGGYNSTYEGASTIRGGRATAGNDSYLSFFTNPGGTSVTERMRITSGGFTKSSNTGAYFGSTGAYHELVSNANADAVQIIQHRGSNPFGMYMNFTTNPAPNNTSNYFIAGGDVSTTRFFIYSNGNITNTNGSYGAISDIKLKENIEDATPKLDDLMKVKVRNYNLIGDDKKQIGVIAQELEEVFPAMIDESEDFEDVEVPQLDEEGNEILNEEGEVVTTKERVSKGTTTKSVKYSVFVPMLIKAIQEQQEIINEMRAEIDLLKTK